MKLLRSEIPEVLILEPSVFRDERGLVFESYNRSSFAAATGLDVQFVQDNHSQSARNVLRALHYQVVRPQGKLIRVARGEAFDVAVDLRRSSPTFRRWVGFTLSEANSRMAWIPPGFAHGVLALTEKTDVLYKVTDFRSPEHERAILWSDPQIAVRWPLSGPPILSARDAAAPLLAAAELYP